MLSACSAPQTRTLRAAPPALTPRAEIVNTPFFPQTEYHCGPAALATVLAFRGVDVTPEALAPEVYLPQRQGSLQAELLASARGRGLLPYRLTPSLGDLLRELDAGNPVLVMQNLSFDWYPKWHYAVAVGYDLASARLILRSGTASRHTLSFSTFERTWARVDYWALVVLRPPDLPATAELDRVLRSALAMEQVGQLASARETYAAAASRWPSNAPARFALGNASYRAGDRAAAEQAFREAISLQPDSASAWNNLAWLLHEQGCGEAARVAVGCAATLAPDDSEIGKSVLELEQSRGGSCAVPACPAL